MRTGNKAFASSVRTAGEGVAAVRDVVSGVPRRGGSARGRKRSVVAVMTLHEGVTATACDEPAIDREGHDTGYDQRQDQAHAPAQMDPDDHAQHLTDGAPGEAMKRRLQGDMVMQRPAP